jgi:hypothetical protein
MFHFLVVIILLSACSPSQPTEPIASAPLVGPVIPVGESEVRDLSPTTEVVSNCGSGGGTVIKHPSMSVVTNYAVEWEVGGTTGVGVTIGEGVVPGGVNLSSTLEGRYATQFDQGIQQTTAWELPAEPSTVVDYTLMWREVWQPGYVEIRLADESVVRVNVRYRIGIQSDIVGKRVENCSGEPIATQVYPTTPPQPPVGTIDCSTMIEGEHHSPILGVDWKFEAINEDRIIHVWSNHWNPNLPEYKFFLPAGQIISFKSGGGSFWIDRPGCDGVAEVLFQRDTFREITIEEYQKYIEQQIIP